MADLKITTGSGIGNDAQNPQTATQADNNGARAGQVQPGTATALLDNTQGVVLTPRAVTTVNLSPASATVQTTAVQKPAPQKHINPVAAAIPITLFILAVVLFWLASRADKKHNV